MGEIADAVLNGDMCQECGEWIGAGDGYPRSCLGCRGTKRISRRTAPKLTKPFRDVGFVVMRDPFHWQARIGAHIINYWPTKSRWSIDNHKSEVGNNENLFKLMKELV